MCIPTFPEGGYAKHLYQVSVSQTYSDSLMACVPASGHVFVLTFPEGGIAKELRLFFYVESDTDYSILQWLLGQNAACLLACQIFTDICRCWSPSEPM